MSDERGLEYPPLTPHGKRRIWRLLRGRFWSFFASHGRQVALMRAKLGVEKSTCVDFSTPSFTLIGVGVRLYMGPKNVNVTKFGDINRPKGVSLARFL